MATEQDNGQPVTPLDAATVVVVRDDRGQLEVFCVRRHASSAFLGGAVVFPGGKLDAADRAAHWQQRSTGLDERACGFAADADHGLSLAVCACRETLEEAALVPTKPELDAAAVTELRASLSASGSVPDALHAQLDARGLQLDTAGLLPFARWITPEVEQRRFDARFYLLALPAGQEGQHDAQETTESVWAPPQQMLTAQLQGKVFMAPPTIRVLELLVGVDSASGARDLAKQQSLEPVQPRFIVADPPMLVIPGDPLHELPDKRVAGPTRFVLRNAHFVSEDPPD